MNFSICTLIAMQDELKMNERTDSGEHVSKQMSERKQIHVILTGYYYCYYYYIIVVGAFVSEMRSLSLSHTFQYTNKHTQHTHLHLYICYICLSKQVEVCRSQHTQTWLGALYIFKGLLLVVGVYMAWETRNVKISALNDSQYIGVSVYSVVITSVIVVVLANFGAISERVTLAFLTITALILTSTTATLCLLFLPKMQDIYAGQGNL